MDRKTLATIRDAERHIRVATYAGFFKGVLVGLECAERARNEGGFTDEWLREVRDHISLAQEHNG